MYIMDASGWRRVQIPSQEEVPMTTVSVPGQGLPMLTGLKHELADPSFYDRHREETAAPAHYIASPDCADRFFFENKRSMITLDVKAPPPPDPYFSSRLLRQRLPPRLAGQFPLGVYPTVAEMEAYSRMKQNHRPSRREPRVSGTPKPVTVVRKPDMLKHIRLGWQTMQQRKRGEMPAMAAYHDLFENILLYDVPGTSKMQNDYSGLMERTDSIDTLCSNMTLPDTMNLNQSNPR